MLKISNVETFYGKIQALRGVDIDVNDGEIVSLFVSNGSFPPNNFLRKSSLLSFCAVFSSLYFSNLGSSSSLLSAPSAKLSTSESPFYDTSSLESLLLPSSDYMGSLKSSFISCISL